MLCNEHTLGLGEILGLTQIHKEGETMMVSDGNGGYWEWDFNATYHIVEIRTILEGPNKGQPVIIVKVEP